MKSINFSVLVLSCIVMLYASAIFSAMKGIEIFDAAFPCVQLRSYDQGEYGALPRLVVLENDEKESSIIFEMLDKNQSILLLNKDTFRSDQAIGSYCEKQKISPVCSVVYMCEEDYFNRIKQAFAGGKFIVNDAFGKPYKKDSRNEKITVDAMNRPFINPVGVFTATYYTPVPDKANDVHEVKFIILSDPNQLASASTDDVVDEKVTAVTQVDQQQITTEHENKKTQRENDSGQNSNQRVFSIAPSVYYSACAVVTMAILYVMVTRIIPK